MDQLYTTKIVKIGSSLGVVLPRDILGAMLLARGDRIVFGVIDGPTLIIRQISPQEIKRLKPTNDIPF